MRLDRMRLLVFVLFGLYLVGCGSLEVVGPIGKDVKEADGVPFYLPKHQFVAYVLGQDENGKPIDSPSIELRLEKMPDNDRKFLIKNWPSPLSDSGFTMEISEGGLPKAVTASVTSQALATIKSLVTLAAVVGPVMALSGPAETKFKGREKKDGESEEEYRKQTEYQKCLYDKGIHEGNHDGNTDILIPKEDSLKNDKSELEILLGTRNKLLIEIQRMEISGKGGGNGPVGVDKLKTAMEGLTKINQRLAEIKVNSLPPSGIKESGTYPIVLRVYDGILDDTQPERQLQKQLLSWHSGLNYGEIGVFIVPFDSVIESDAVVVDTNKKTNSGGQNGR